MSRTTSAKLAEAMRHIPRRVALVLEAFPLIVEAALLSVFFVPSRLRRLRDEGGDEALELARSFRLAVVWAILMVGSVLALAGTAVQVALAYQ